MYLRKCWVEEQIVVNNISFPKSPLKMKSGYTFRPTFIEYGVDFLHYFIFEEIIKGKIYQKMIAVSVLQVDENIDSMTLSMIQAEFDGISGV